MWRVVVALANNNVGLLISNTGNHTFEQVPVSTIIMSLSVTKRKGDRDRKKKNSKQEKR